MGADAEWEDAEVLGGDSPVGQDGAQQPLPLEGADQPQLLIYVFLAYLALYYTMWAARAKNPSEVARAICPASTRCIAPELRPVPTRDLTA